MYIDSIYSISEFANVDLPFRSLNASILQISHNSENALCKFTSASFFFNGDLISVSQIFERLDWANNSSCASTEGFVNAVLFNSFA